MQSDLPTLRSLIIIQCIVALNPFYNRRKINLNCRGVYLKPVCMSVGVRVCVSSYAQFPLVNKVCSNLPLPSMVINPLISLIRQYGLVYHPMIGEPPQLSTDFHFVFIYLPCYISNGTIWAIINYIIHRF